MAQDATPVLTAEPFVYTGTELDAMAEACNYCLWIMQYFAPYLGPRTVEIGAGTGNFSELLLNSGRIADLVLFEAAANMFPFLRQRFDNRNVRLHCGYFDPTLLHSPMDSVVLVNVLEHVADDVSLLSQIHQCLRPGGHLLLFVPALRWNFGSLDKAFGHWRRYDKGGLERKFEQTGFRVQSMRYVNAMGIAAWFFAGRLLNQTTLKAAQVRWYDRWVIPWSFRLEHIWSPPLGQSLLAVGAK